MFAVDPVKARQFAVRIVRRLRDAGFEALWAGGCVRDQLMGREPKDYDVATSAEPDEIRHVFGHRRTLAIGASFGVITVVGDRGCGQIDVATFRRDAPYSDGRHPDSVTFCGAAEDALRRDFTINGLFYDPLGDQVLDFVGGQADLDQCLVRAIGDPAARIAEDKLRMLRAVRFASNLGFEIEPATWRAVQVATAGIHAVSAERITEELRRMLVHPARSRAVALLRGSGLLHEIIPEAEGIIPRDQPADESAALAWDSMLRVLDRLEEPPLAVVLAALLRPIFLATGSDAAALLPLCRRWRLRNDDVELLTFCLANESLVRSARSAAWPRLQRILVDSRRDSLLRYAEAVAQVVDGGVGEIDYCRDRLRLPIEQLDPAPLVNGNDLRAEGIPPGPIYRELLDGARDLQLTGQLATKDEAISWIRQRWSDRDRP